MNTESNKTSGVICSDLTAVRPRVAVQTKVMGVVGFALATAVCANISVPIPGTPVPMTLQTVCVLLAGVTLGARLGALSMAFYLLLGTAGYHAFAGGEWGLTTVLGATGGYLIGFVLAQPVIGALTNARGCTWRRLVTAILAGNGIIFGCGLLWLWLWSGCGLSQALAWGLWPFIPGLIIKSGLAIGIGRAALQKARPVFDGR